jgi:hypothetical protein
MGNIIEPSEEILSVQNRCRDARMHETDKTGEVFSLEQANTRKVVIQNFEGECRLELYNSKAEFDQHQAPFESHRISGAERDGTNYWQESKHGAKTLYVRVLAVKPKCRFYLHVEWYC